jgi:peptide methionine sulfoxide reductase msrA/msrB
MKSATIPQMIGLAFGVGLLAVLAVLVARQVRGGNVPVSAETVASEGLNTVHVRVIGPEAQLTDPVEVARVKLSDEEWRERLTPEQYRVVRDKGTERAFAGALLHNKDEGFYTCVACDLPLFASETKFESGTGWPSFYTPAAQENVREESDVTLGMRRTEILCARCDGHLGHVFSDGPKPTGLRYCLNSASLRFVAKEEAMSIAEEGSASSSDVGIAKLMSEQLPVPENDAPLTADTGEASAVFAGGCFWCTEAVFEGLEGVKDVVSGYCGGDPQRADYTSVCSGSTGHAEAIQITYDPSIVTFGQLLRLFFATHDPTTKDRQGPDRGTQYRSAVFYASEEEKRLAESYIKQITSVKAFPQPVVTTLEPLTEFYQAEEYHQDFVENNPQHPYVVRWAKPKLKKRDELLKGETS